MVARIVKWLGKTVCDFCKTDLRTKPWFVDGRTLWGPWALMCPACWDGQGCGTLGPGHGQKYDGDTLEKIDG